MTTAIECQVLVAACWSSKAVHPLPISVPKKEHFLDTAVPAGRLERKENARIAFSTVSDVMKSVWIVLDTDFWQLTEMHGDGDGDALFGVVYLFLTDPPYSVQSSTGNKNSMIW